MRQPFGETVPGYTIPVLNEREVRAAAGILFVIIFIGLQQAGLAQNFFVIKFALTLFLSDMLIRVFISPRFSPTLILGRLIVRNQVPEYVGALQKKFAWYIGIGIASIVFVHLVLFNAFSPITGIGCLLCIVFLFCESAFGICIGCKIYKWVYKEKAQYCPGEVCEINQRHAIQKTSKTQWLILLGFTAYLVLLITVFKAEYAKMPVDLFGITKNTATK